MVIKLLSLYEGTGYCSRSICVQIKNETTHDGENHGKLFKTMLWLASFIEVALNVYL